MRSSRLTVSLMVFAFVLVSTTSHTTAEKCFGFLDKSDPSLISSYHRTETNTYSVTRSNDGGIKENIPAKYAGRYSAWKEAFLSTEVGREQWRLFETNPQFTLTITMSSENAEGASTGKYKWDQSGNLIAATISLGNRLDDGYPNRIYFPVMNSLVPADSSERVNGITLAATKLAHEFGHVLRTAQVDPQLYQLQGQLIPQYNKIFLNNGRKDDDPRLLELARKMGGTPVTIWEDREYWGETNAMAYLRDRITEDDVRCLLFNRIRHSVDLYAKQYEQRFFDVAHSVKSKKLCGW